MYTQLFERDKRGAHYLFAHYLRQLGFGGQQPTRVKFAIVHKWQTLREQEVSLKLTPSHHRKDRKGVIKAIITSPFTEAIQQSETLDKCPLTGQNTVTTHTKDQELGSHCIHLATGHQKLDSMQNKCLWPVRGRHPSGQINMP